MEINLLKHQEEFVFSTHKHTILVCGFGAGKTEDGVAKATIKLITTSHHFTYENYNK